MDRYKFNPNHVIPFEHEETAILQGNLWRSSVSNHCFIVHSKAYSPHTDNQSGQYIHTKIFTGAQILVRLEACCVQNCFA